MWHWLSGIALYLWPSLRPAPGCSLSRQRLRSCGCKVTDGKPLESCSTHFNRRRFSRRHRECTTTLYNKYSLRVVAGRIFFPSLGQAHPLGSSSWVYSSFSSCISSNQQQSEIEFNTNSRLL